MELVAARREVLGKKVKSLRREGKLPAVVFGKGTESVPITLDSAEFLKTYREAGESTLVDLLVDKQKPQKVLVSETEVDPVSGKILHASLQAVKLTEKITATVSIEVVGESPVVKSGEGVLITLLDEVEVEALPQDLPSEIKVDVSGLKKIGVGLAIKDLPVDRLKVEIKHNPQDLVVKVAHAKMEEEEVVAEEVPIEEAVEITKEKKEKESTESTEETGGTETRERAKKRS